MATGGNGSDEIINFKCCICAKKDITREGERYCVECQDYFCEACTDLHNMFPSAMGVHQLLDRTHFRLAGEKTLPSFPVERCTIHKAKLLDMYCADHDEVSCGTCVALHHRECRSIHSVSDEIDKVYKESEADKTKKQLATTMTAMEDLKKAKRSLVTKLESNKENVIASIQDFRREMDVMLDKLESETVRELEREYRKMKTTLDEKIKETEQYIDDLKQYTDKLHNFAGNKAQEFVIVKLLEKNIVEANKAKGDIEKTMDIEMKFIADSNITAFMKKLKTFGHLYSHELRTTLYGVKCKKEINVRQVNDYRTCNINGSCFTEDGILLIADYRNEKLKRVDLSLKSVKDYLDLEASPHALCPTISNEVAVNLDTDKVQFVSLGDKMVPIKQLKMGHYCRGLAYKDCKLFISDNESSLYIHDMNGTMLRKITNDQFGQAIFSNNRHISISSNGERMYVADFDKGLKTIDIQGNYESSFNEPDVVQPESVCTDGRGNIFLCGWGQSNIVQINEKTKEKKCVIGKITNGLTACFDTQRNKLAVSQHNTDTVEVYELE